jgi:replication fork protection complex subunit Csm3/Swi3
MLSLYQLWLDELYPRAKFLDSLAMVEKLGHSKSMQFRRRDWINEGKPRDTWPEAEPQPQAANGDARSKTIFADGSNSAEQQAHVPDEVNAAAKIDGQPNDPDGLFLSEDEREAGAPDEDELDALLAEGSTGAKTKLAPTVPQPSQDSLRTSPVREGDLDALWAEHEADAEKENRDTGKSLKHGPPPQFSPPADDFADEMEAMADLDMW